MDKPGQNENISIKKEITENIFPAASVSDGFTDVDLSTL
jgi:hypothetical protein